MNAIGVVECKNISKGIVVTDEMLKSAGIWLLSSGSVCPGKYVEDPLEKGMATHSSILALKNTHGQRSLAGCSPWGCKESDMTE